MIEQKCLGDGVKSDSIFPPFFGKHDADLISHWIHTLDQDHQQSFTY